MLGLLAGCENVGWGGFEVQLRPPPASPSSVLALAAPAEEDPILAPIDLGPLVYLVERSGTRARIYPVARWNGGQYAPLPELGETPDLLARFPLERWEEGTEFTLLDRGGRAGTLISDGSTEWEEGFCQPRPLGQGWLELQPGFENTQVFLALRKADLGGALRHPDPGSVTAQGSPANRQTAAVSFAQIVVQQGGIPWPPSIPEAVRESRAFALGSGEEGLAVSLGFGVPLSVGPGTPNGYAVLALGRREGDRWRPIWSWYQPVREGQAIARVRGAAVLGSGSESDLFLEIFGAESRWLAVLGERQGEWGFRYQDACGLSPRSAAIRSWDGP
jgi:hypothetical protein